MPGKFFQTNKILLKYTIYRFMLNLENTMSTKLWLIVRNSLFHNRGRTLKLTLMSLMLTTFIIQQFHHKYSGNLF